MKRSTLYVILGAIAIAAVIGVIAWRVRQAAQPEEEIRTATVERGTLLVAVSASGNIEPLARANLTFEQPGTVVEVLAAVGDEVKEGDVLARLDTTQIELQVSQARAALASAKARLDQLRTGAQPGEIAAAEANVRAAEAQVNGAAAQLAQLKAGPTEAQLAAAEADLASATVQQKQAQDLYDNLIECFTVEFAGVEQTVCPGLGAPEEQARYSLRVADKALAAAQARYDEVTAGATQAQLAAAEANLQVAIAQRDTARAQLDLLLNGATEGQTAAVEAQVAQAQAALGQAELALDLAALRAPFDGVVAQVNIKPDQIAPAGLPAIVLLDPSQFHITVSVDEIDVGKLAVGQGAQMTVEAFPDATLQGRVERIAPAATLQIGVVYYDIVIALEPTDVPIRADMTASATIVVQELPNVLLLPTWVIRVDRATGQTYVDKQAGNETERVDVTLGTRYEGLVEVIDGLQEGDVAVWVSNSRFTVQ